MFTMRKDFKILWAIIRTDAVDMVDIFVTMKSAANHFLCHKSMFWDSFVLVSIGMVRCPNPDVSIGSSHPYNTWSAVIGTVVGCLRSNWGHLECASARLTGKIEGHRNQPFRCRAEGVTSTARLSVSPIISENRGW